ncbi:hypothetical protein IGI04_040491 [Brassica rapa subsp. trilocularis]|uniref:Uncharacterized protein n=1 Tax=Brassica rapa subsp. trilocularis TaxID=1813537 RepID=A0ABQ7KQX6_BRACM|nr:hypothetical protein IGI04_040491 [Brassica rapa subsp. trilocularis]
MFSGAIYHAISSDGYFSLAQSGCPVVFLDFRLFPVGFLPSSTFSGGFFPWLSPNYGCYFWKPPWPSLYLNLLKFSFEVENTEVLQKEYVTQGANKRKRVDLVQKKMGTATEDQQQVPMVIIDPFAAMRDVYGELTEEFWQKAPIEAVHVEFERRMGPERTMRKHRFVEDLLASSNASTFNAEQVSSYQEEDMDDHSDHIILEMEERRGAGFVLDQFTAETVQKA